MKQKNEYTLIDQKFIVAVDAVIKKNKILNIKPKNDAQIGYTIYPSNRSIISAVRIQQKHIPHLALINFAKAFGVDMNYFYYEDYSFRFNNTTPTIDKDGLSNELIKIPDVLKEVKSLRNQFLKTKETYSETNHAEDKIDTFVNQLDDKMVIAFYKLLSGIKTVYRNEASLLQQVLFDRSLETDAHIKSLTTQINQLQKELIIAKDNAFLAQQNEKKTLKMYIGN